MPKHTTALTHADEHTPHPAKPHKKPHEKHHDKPHPGHHDKKPHSRGKGIELLGQPGDLLQRLLPGKEDREWATGQIANEGPDHKQLYAVLLMKRMSELLRVAENKTGSVFEIQPGDQMYLSRHGEIKPTPLTMPAASLEEADAKKVIEILSKGPEHELVLFSSLLQSVEWIIKTIPK